MIDVRQNGIGDIVVACWIVHSAAAIAEQVRLNPRNHWALATLLGVPEECLTREEASDWSQTLGIGHQFEYHQVNVAPMSRFDAWCQSLDLPRLSPVRPPYREAPEDGAWADQQWSKVAPADAPRILLFPDAAWSLRAWPKAYFVDLTSQLNGLGYAVAAMAGTQAAVEYLPCRWWSGFTLGQTAAMTARASLVVANDSGPSHLAAAIGTRTIAICGPTDPQIVFAHDPNVQPATLDAALLSCVPCHFSGPRGYRHACEVGGCQGLMRLDPDEVRQRVDRAARISRTRESRS
jgi:Glycosyltransferase family 9 (heptosyltransferase)